MRVIARESNSVVYRLNDFFNRDLNIDIEADRTYTKDGVEVKIKVELDEISEAFIIQMSLFNTDAGAHLGSKEFVVSFKDLKDNDMLITDAVIISRMIEELSFSGVNFKSLGEGLWSGYSIELSNGNILGIYCWIDENSNKGGLKFRIKENNKTESVNYWDF